MSARSDAVAGIRTQAAREFTQQSGAHETPGFQEVMAEQLARTPWLLLSMAVHAIVIALLFLIPVEAPPSAPPVATVLAVAPEDRIDEREKPIETPEVEATDPSDVVELAPSLDDQPPSPHELDCVEDYVPSDHFDPAMASAVGLGSAGPAGYAGRRPGGRPRGGAGWHEHMEKALSWLRDHQDADGRWDCDAFMKHDQQGAPCDGRGDPLHDVGVTGLALLAFLGDGNTLRDGPYRDVVRAGVNWLRLQQDPDTGLIGTPDSHSFIYDHTIATLALCEAQGLSQYRTLRGPAQAAVRHLQAHRNPYGVWRYHPRSGDQDMSITGWAYLALASADGFGLEVDRRSFGFIDSFIDEMTDDHARVGYSERGGLSSRHAGAHEQRFPAERNECMTATGLLCQMLRKDATLDDAKRRKAELVARRQPVWESGAKGSSLDFYAWYYGTYAMYQIGGPLWETWSRSLGQAVLKHQRLDGNFAGSWDPVDAWGDDGGRVYSTAILALTLQAYYRYARTIGGR